MSKESLDMFLEEVKKDYNEAVNLRDISKDAQVEVLKQKELHRKSNVKKNEVDSPELHMMSPLKKAEREHIMKAIQSSTSATADDNRTSSLRADPGDETVPDNASRTKQGTSTKDKRGTDNVNYVKYSDAIFDAKAITPDTLWKLDETPKKQRCIPFVYVPTTKELFYVTPGLLTPKPSADIYDLKNIALDYYKQYRMTLLPSFSFISDRTHGGMLGAIMGAKEYSNNPKEYLKEKNEDFPATKWKIDWKTARELYDYVASPDSDKVILGRYLDGLISFWTKISPNLLNDITSRLKSKIPTVDIRKIYMTDRESIRR